MLYYIIFYFILFYFILFYFILFYFILFYFILLYQMIFPFVEKGKINECKILYKLWFTNRTTIRKYWFFEEKKSADFVAT